MTLSVSRISMAHFPSQWSFTSLRLAGHLFVQSSLKHSPQHFSQVQVRTLTGAVHHLGSFIFQLYVDLLCLGPLSCWVTHFKPSFNCQRDGLTFYSRICWSWISRLTQIMIPPFNLQLAMALWSHLYKGHSSRNLVVCFNGTLQR